MCNSENSKGLVPESYIDSALPTSTTKTTPPKKILGERNVSDTCTQTTKNLDLKPSKAEKRTSCELDISPDPMTNYPSPRPVYLRYKPNWRQEIFVKLEKEAKEGRKPDTKLSSCLSPEVEEEEESYGSDNEIEDEEEGECYSPTWKELLIKSLFVFIALVLCSSYIYTQNGRTQNFSPRVENFTSQGLSSFNVLPSEREVPNQMFWVLIEDESKLFHPNMPDIVEIESKVTQGDEVAEISYDLVTQESEIEHEKEILGTEQESLDIASRIMFQIANTQLESDPEQRIEKREVPEESENEHESEILERDQESIDVASEMMFQIAKTQLESNPERIIKKGEVVFRPFIGVLISSLLLASLLSGVCLMKKKKSVSFASSETKTLQVESLLEDETKGDSGFKNMCKPCDSFTNKLPSHSKEEFDRVLYQSRVPVVELLGELEVGEVSISSQRRSRAPEGKESIYSASLEKPGLKVSPVDLGFSGFSSANSASNGRLLSDRRSINQENNWTEDRSRKEVNTATPLRRSSRIRSRSSIQSP